MHQVTQQHRAQVPPPKKNRSPRLFIFARLHWSVPPRYYTGRMSTVKTWQIESTSAEATAKLGYELGVQLRGGEVIELLSDLGGGKTTFTKGVAAGMGSADHVKSPSFSVSNVYTGDKLQLYHFDLYRLDDAGLIRHELAEAAQQDDAVVIVEWAQLVEDVLPDDRVVVTITATAEDSRQLVFRYHERYDYLFPHNT